MPISATIFALATFALGIVNVYAEGIRNEHAAQRRNRVSFDFRSNREIRGADLSVYTLAGECIISQKLKRRKVSVDFDEVTFGEYIIRITSPGRVLHESRFLKK